MTKLILSLVKLVLIQSFLSPKVVTLPRTDNPATERISNHYLVWELFWRLEFRIYIFPPMRMTDAILSWSPPRAT